MTFTDHNMFTCKCFSSERSTGLDSIEIKSLCAAAAAAGEERREESEYLREIALQTARSVKAEAEEVIQVLEQRLPSSQW